MRCAEKKSRICPVAEKITAQPSLKRAEVQERAR
jgi:hypothetical protein